MVWPFGRHDQFVIARGKHHHGVEGDHSDHGAKRKYAATRMWWIQGGDIPRGKL